ncbi:MAG TPA: hypothetical protein VEB67_03300, partial [Nitrososphaerales archaeon]|nr:hypothetical protein [Nitrososphaerales archaeon]
MASGLGFRSTGLLVFGARLVSAFTGLVFILMTAKWLGPSGLGLWEVIVTVVAFATYPVGIVAYWATREVARGRMLGRTALFFGGVLSCGGLAVYLLFTAVTYGRLAAPLSIFLFGGILVPLGYWTVIANAILQGSRPAMYGWSLVVSELTKVLV